MLTGDCERSRPRGPQSCHAAHPAARPALSAGPGAARTRHALPGVLPREDPHAALAAVVGAHAQQVEVVPVERLALGANTRGARRGARERGRRVSGQVRQARSVGANESLGVAGMWRAGARRHAARACPSPRPVASSRGVPPAAPASPGSRGGPSEARPRGPGAAHSCREAAREAGHGGGRQGAGSRWAASGGAFRSSLPPGSRHSSRRQPASSRPAQQEQLES